MTTEHGTIHDPALAELAVKVELLWDLAVTQLNHDNMGGAWYPNIGAARDDARRAVRDHRDWLANKAFRGSITPDA